MKANELMIGDWVLDKKTNRPYKIIGTNDLLFHNDYSPIPLTAEILKKNGFVYNVEETCVTDAFHYWLLENSRFALADDSWWRSVKDDKLRVKFSGFPLEYVHQLQHALRLCNIEKEIELW